MTDAPRPDRASPLTLADIAGLLKLSEGTVSRALRGNPGISKQTRERVRRIANELGYVPNAAARSLARNSSRTLGLIVPDVTDPVHGLIVAGFGRVAEAHGYTMIMLDGARDEARRDRGLRTLQEHQAQGVAFCSSPISPIRARAELNWTQTVFILPENEEVADATDSMLGRIRADDGAGISQLIQHLLSLGKTQFAYVNGPEIASNRLRRAIILKTLETLSNDPRIREYSATSAEREQLDHVAALVARERPDALMCYDDKLALHLLDALRRHNVRVPQDVAVTGFDGIPFSAISNPRLTTVVQPAESIGEVAAMALIEAIDTGLPPGDVTLPVTVAIRGSSRVRDDCEAPSLARDVPGLIG